MICPLCESKSTTSFQSEKYHRCGSCFLIWKDTKLHVSLEKEKARYETHNNEISNLGYLEFLQPLIQEIQKNHFAKSQLGLDFGCGPTKALEEVLKIKNIKIDSYDPYFFPTEFGIKKYDFVVAHEVAEHFRSPRVDFLKIKDLLKESGVLYLRTLLYPQGQALDLWHYARDYTHICFYSEQTIDYLKSKFSKLVFIS